MSIIGYARVSTGDQTTAQQTDALTAAGAIRVFTDTISGTASKRPGLDAMLEFAREGDTIAVVRLDRLGRSLRDLLDLVATFKTRGLHLRSLAEAIDTSTPSGELVFNIFGSVAQFERALIVERTQAGLAQARKRGAKFGRPRIDRDRLESAAALVRAGQSYKQAAAQLGISSASICRYMRDNRQAA